MDLRTVVFPLPVQPSFINPLFASIHNFAEYLSNFVKFNAGSCA